MGLFTFSFLLSLLHLLPLQWKTVRMVTTPRSLVWHPLSTCSLPPSARSAHSRECDQTLRPQWLSQEYWAARATSESLRKLDKAPHYKVQPSPRRLSLPDQLRDEEDARIGAAPSLDRKPCRCPGGHWAPEVITGIVLSLTPTPSPSPTPQCSCSLSIKSPHPSSFPLLY